MEIEAPSVGMSAISAPENLNRTPTLASRLQDTTGSFLRSAEAKNNVGPPWMRTKEFPHTNPSETLIGLRDEISNTSFLVESGAEPGVSNEDRYTMIRWLTMGEDKGELPGGWIKIIQREGLMEPIVASGKGELFPVENDRHWQTGGAHDWYDHVGKETPTLKPEEIETIMEKLSNSKVDAEFTERIAQYVEADYAMVGAILEYEDAKRSWVIGRRGRIEAARKKCTEALSRWNALQDSFTPLYKKTSQDADAESKEEDDKTSAERKAMVGIRAFIQGLKENGVRVGERMASEIYLHDGDPQKALTAAYLKGLGKVVGPLTVSMQEDLDRLKKTAEISNGVEKLVLKSLAGVLSLEIRALRLILGNSQDRSYSLFAQRAQLRAERKISKPGGENGS